MREELNEAIACTERDIARGVRSTVRVSAYKDGRKARNLKVYRGTDGLYVILGFSRKYPTMLKDMAGGAHICRFDGKPVVITFLEI
jgi:hypothetical protein